MVCNYGTILANMLCEKVQWNWSITADNCKQMLLLGEFHYALTDKLNLRQ
jgi:hypothetical protein